MSRLIVFFVILSSYTSQAQKSKSFSVETGYLTAEFTKEVKLYKGIESTSADRANVKALKISATEKDWEPIKEMSNLKFLYLDKTFTANNYYLTKEKLTAFFELINSMKNIEYISCHDVVLLRYLSSFTHLKGLKLKSIQWSLFEESMFEMGNLEVLVIEDSKITKIPSVVGHLPNLKQLEIRALNLTTLPNMEGLDELLVLSAIIGRATELPAGFSDLKKLEYLKLTGLTNFRYFPIEVCGLTSLKYLELDCKNVKKSIPSDIGNLVKLEKLYLNEFPDLRTFPEEISKLSNLKEIYVSGFRVVNWLTLNNLDHPINLILDQGGYSSAAKGLKEMKNLNQLILPKNIAQSHIKKFKKYIPAEKIIFFGK